MFTTRFYKDLFERTISTFAQALVAVLTAAGTGLLEVDWLTAVSVAGMAALVAALKGFAASAINSDTGASFGTSVPTPSVAAVEHNDDGQYVAEEAAPYPTGTPVDVIPEYDKDGDGPYDLYDHR